MAAISGDLAALIKAAGEAAEAEATHYRDVYEPLERVASRATSGSPAINIDPAAVDENNALCAANCEAEYRVADFPISSAADFEAKIAFMVEREMFRGVDQGERVLEDARHLAAVATPTPIQLLAQLRSDLSSRQEAVHDDSGDMALSRHLSHDLSRLLHVMLSQQPQSMVDVYSLVAAMGELASQELNPDPDKPDVAEIGEAGELIQIAATSIAAFLVLTNVQPLNAYDRNDAKRCLRLSAERFPQPAEIAA